VRAPNVETAANPDLLSAPVGSLMRAATAIAPEDSLARAASAMRRNGAPVLPLAVDDRLVGVLTEEGLAVALARGAQMTDSAESVMASAPTIAPYATGAEALRRFADWGLTALLVVDDAGRLMGMLCPSDLYPRKRQLPRPSLVGGMATPFGVYLTNGAIGAGAGGLALVSTGFLLFTLLFGSQLAVDLGTRAISASGPVPTWAIYVLSALPLLLFMLLMRLVPLSGTHGAEHQVVHALERGEELTEEIVRRMPRVHPRCGTNLAAAATIFLSIFGTEWVRDFEIRFIVAAIVTMLFWRKLGSFLQQYVTTRPASDAQLRGAIRAANELLEKFSRSRLVAPNPLQRIWNSGMLHVMAGSTLAAGIVWAIAKVFNLDIDL